MNPEVKLNRQAALFATILSMKAASINAFALSRSNGLAPEKACLLGDGDA